MHLCSYEVLDFSFLRFNQTRRQEIATVKRRFISRFSLHNYIVRIINHHDVKDEQWAVRGVPSWEHRFRLPIISPEHGSSITYPRILLCRRCLAGYI